MFQSTRLLLMSQSSTTMNVLRTSTIPFTRNIILPTLLKQRSSLLYSVKNNNNNLINSKRFLHQSFISSSPSHQGEVPPPAQAPVLRPRSKFRTAGKFIWKTTLYSILATIGYFSYQLYREIHPKTQLPQSKTFENGSPRKNLVILGTGWGSVSLLQELDTTLYNVIIVSPRNYFLFTPLLPSTPVGTVNVKSIVEPIRSIIRRTKGSVVYYEAWATDIDPQNKQITVKSVFPGEQEDIKTIDYDYLVLSIGATSTTFNIPGVSENAIFMKEISDSEKVRSKIMKTIEKASFLPRDDPERRKLLNFLVVGGGPTGVEFAAELQDFIKQDLKKIMPEISQDIKVSLIEGLPNILNMFDKKLIDYTEKFLINEDVDLKLNTMVKKVNPDSIIAKCKGEEIELPYGVLVWSTGIKPQQLTLDTMKKLDEQTERRGLLIDDKLRLLGAQDSIFGIGDCTFHPGFVPTAQVAHQEGQYLAKTFQKLYEIDQLKWEQEQPNADINSIKTNIDKIESSIVDFKYAHMGSLAYIGGDKAIMDLNIAGAQYRLSGGNFVFWFWRSVYLSMCVSLRNRVLVTADWVRTFVFGRDSSV